MSHPGPEQHLVYFLLVFFDFSSRVQFFSHAYLRVGVIRFAGAGLGVLRARQGLSNHLCCR